MADGTGLREDGSGSWKRRGGGTDVLVVHEGVPDTIPAAANETGTRMALANLANLVQKAHRRR